MGLMSTSQQELPPSLPPTYHESIRGAPPRQQQQQQQQQPYHGSPTGWTPPTGSWEPSPGPSSGVGYQYPHHLNNGLTSSHPYTGQQQQQQPPLPPRAPTAASTSSYQPTSAPQRQSDSRSNSSGDNDSASFGGGAGGGKDEKKRSSFFFGSGGRNKDKGKDREKEREKERERERRKEQEDDARSEKEKERRQRERVREEERERERERETAPSAKYTYASPEESEMRSYLARIPAQAQKALAPLKMQSDTKDITGVFAVEVPSASSPNATSLAPASNGASTVVLPTAVFESTGRNDIDITLYLRPSLESLQQQQSQLQSQSQARSYNPYAAPPPLPYRNNQNTNANVPLEILAKNKKGRILLSLPDRIPNRPLRIICTLDSHVYVQLPIGFDGKLAIWAPGGNIELSEPLKRNSTIIPSTTQNAYIVVYRITPEASAGHGQMALSSGNNGGGGGVGGAGCMDLCQLNTSKGRVKVEYARPPKAGAGSGGDCVIA